MKFFLLRFFVFPRSIIKILEFSLHFEKKKKLRNRTNVEASRKHNLPNRRDVTSFLEEPTAILSLSPDTLYLRVDLSAMNGVVEEEERIGETARGRGRRELDARKGGGLFTA